MLSERENINKELEELGAGQLVKNLNSNLMADDKYFENLTTKLLTTIENDTEKTISIIPQKKWLSVLAIAAVLVLGVFFITPKQSDDIFQQISKAEAAYYLSIYEEDFIDDANTINQGLLSFSDDTFDKEFLEMYLFND